jgi:hypothetical protein
LLVLASESRAAEATHFAFLPAFHHESTAPAEEAAAVCLGSYEDNRFAQPPEETETPPWGGDGPPDIDKNVEFIHRWYAALKRELDTFPVGKKLTGIDGAGHGASAVVSRVNPEDDGEGAIFLQVRTETATPQYLPVLLASSPLPLEWLKAESVPLEPEIAESLRKRADELWQKHLPERGGGPEGKYELGAPAVQRIDGAPGLLAVVYPVVVHDSDDSTDDRASFFFIWSETSHSVVRGEFGHPEWSSESTVKIIKPQIYFRIGAGGEPLFAGVSQGGWEDDGTGIFDLRTGRELVHCH